MSLSRSSSAKKPTKTKTDGRRSAKELRVGLQHPHQPAEAGRWTGGSTMDLQGTGTGSETETDGDGGHEKEEVVGADL